MKCIECQEELKIHLMNLDKEISIIELKETTIDNLSTVEKEIIK